MKRFSLLLFVPAWLAGCAATSPTHMASEAYRSRPVLRKSLFPADGALLGDEAIDRLLSSRIELPRRCRLAVLRLEDGPDRPWWWSAQSSFVNENTVKGLLDGLKQCRRISDASALPAMLTPERFAVPYLREAAARFQAELLLAYRASSRTHQKSRLLGKDQVKAWSTVEAVLLDVRTGVVPFTCTVTRETETARGGDDLNFGETLQRARLQALTRALDQLAADLTTFLDSIPDDDAQAPT